MNLPRLSAQGILVYPLSGYHDIEAPRAGADPRFCGATRGGGLPAMQQMDIGPVYKLISNYFGMEHTGKTGHSDTIIQVFLLSLIVNRMNQED
jgi:hypothetical protein